MSDDEINFPRLLKNGIKVGKKFPKRGGGGANYDAQNMTSFNLFLQDWEPLSWNLDKWKLELNRER